MKIEEYNFAYNLLPKDSTWKVHSVRCDHMRFVRIHDENNLMQIKFNFSSSIKPHNRYRITDCAFRELKDASHEHTMRWNYADFSRDNLSLEKCKIFLEIMQSTGGPSFYSKENRYYLKSQRKAASETSKKLRAETV